MLLEFGLGGWAGLIGVFFELMLTHGDTYHLLPVGFFTIFSYMYGNTIVIIETQGALCVFTVLLPPYNDWDTCKLYQEFRGATKYVFSNKSI